MLLTHLWPGTVLCAAIWRVTDRHMEMETTVIPEFLIAKALSWLRKIP